MTNSSTATAMDFDRAAQSKANAFWGYAALTAACGYWFKWWAILPAILAVLSVVQSISATRFAHQLRNGTYPLLNLNNGAPDGDASNWGKS